MAPARTPRLDLDERLYRGAGAPALVRPKPSSPWAPAPDPEVRAPGTKATIWLNRSLGEGDPPVFKLGAEAGKTLVASAERLGVRWPILLGALRAAGFRSSNSLSSARVDALLARASRAALAGEGMLGERSRVIARFSRAVGLHALVTGLEQDRPALVRRVLASGRIELPTAARDDVAAGRIDPRVLGLLLYLAEDHGSVRVSSLHTGHPFAGRSGSVSAHAYGLALDVIALGGKPLFGRPALVERAARRLLLLPADALPQQILSIASVRGAVAAFGPRPDHLHVGY